MVSFCGSDWAEFEYIYGNFFSLCSLYKDWKLIKLKSFYLFCWIVHEVFNNIPLQKKKKFVLTRRNAFDLASKLGLELLLSRPEYPVEILDLVRLATLLRRILQVLVEHLARDARPIQRQLHRLRVQLDHLVANRLVHVAVQFLYDLCYQIGLVEIKKRLKHKH